MKKPPINYPRTVKGKEDIAKALDLCIPSNNRVLPQSSKGRRVKLSSNLSNALLYSGIGGLGGYGAGKLYNYLLDSDSSAPWLGALTGAAGGGYYGYTREGQKTPTKPEADTTEAPPQEEELKEFLAAMKELEALGLNKDQVAEALVSASSYINDADDTADAYFALSPSLSKIPKIKSVLTSVASKYPRLAKVLPHLGPIALGAQGLTSAYTEGAGAKNIKNYADAMTKVIASDPRFKDYSPEEKDKFINMVVSDIYAQDVDFDENGQYYDEKDVSNYKRYSSSSAPYAGLDKEYKERAGTSNPMTSEEYSKRLYEIRDKVNSEIGTRGWINFGKDLARGGLTYLAPGYLGASAGISDFTELGGDALQSHYRNDAVGGKSTFEGFSDTLGKKMNIADRRITNDFNKSLLHGLGSTVKEVATNPLVSTLHAGRNIKDGAKSALKSLFSLF